MNITNNQIKIGAILSYITMAISIVIGVFTTPLIINALGSSEYGVYVLFGSLIATLTLFDLGLNNTIVRYISRYQADKQITKQKYFLTHITLVYILISLLVLGIGFYLYLNLGELFSSLTSNELIIAEKIFVILVVSLAISLPGGMYTAIANAYERFVFVRSINLVKLLIRTIFLLLILKFDASAYLIVLMDLFLTILTIFIMFGYCYRRLKVRFIWCVISPKLLREIFGYSGWIFLLAIYQQIQWESGKLILGNTSGTHSVTVYALGVMLALYYSGLATTILGMYLPKANQIASQEGSKNLSMDVGKQISDYIFTILLPVIIAFYFFGEEFINLWLGPEFENVYFITIVIMVLYLPALMQGFMSSVLEANKKVAIKSIILISSAIFGMILSYYFSFQHGEYGILLGLSIGSVISQALLNLYYIKLGYAAYRFYQLTRKQLLLIFALFLTSSILYNCIGEGTWILFLIKSGVYAIFILLVIPKYFLAKK